MNFLYLAGIVVVGAVGALPWMLRWRRRRRTRKAWLDMSPRLELSLSGDTHERLLSGRYRGHFMEVRLTAHGASQVRVPLKVSLSAGLRLSRQEPGRTPLPLRGPRDIQVGDPDLDKAFLVQGKNPAAVIRLLREPGVREALLELQAASPRALITENEVLAPIESPVQEEPCRRALRSAALLTSALLEATARHQALAEAAREQARRELPPVPSPRVTASLEDEPSSHEDEDSGLAYIRDTFATRMRIHTWVSTVPLLAGFFLFGICGLVSQQAKTMFGLPLSSWMITSAGLFFWGLLGHHFSARNILLCPACGFDVIEPHPEKQEFGKGGDEGIIITLTLSSEICPHCRTVLTTR